MDFLVNVPGDWWAQKIKLPLVVRWHNMCLWFRLSCYLVCCIAPLWVYCDWLENFSNVMWAIFDDPTPTVLDVWIRQHFNASSSPQEVSLLHKIWWFYSTSSCRFENPPQSRLVCCRLFVESSCDKDVSIHDWRFAHNWGSQRRAEMNQSSSAFHHLPFVHAAKDGNVVVE